MMPQLASRSFAIRDLFAPPFHFISPSFQRPFSWSADNAERLLCDIQAACADAPKEIYFLGAILLVRVPEPGEQSHRLSEDDVFSGPERIHKIIDGQQRLVTMTLLLAVMRTIILERGTPGHPQVLERLTGALLRTTGRPVFNADAVRPPPAGRIQLRGAGNAILDLCLGRPEAATAAAGAAADGPEACRHLLEIRELFERQLSLLDGDELDRLALFVLDNCCLVTVVTTTIDRAYQMFIVLNDTGKRLTRSDILKADLISQVPAAERHGLTVAWDELAARLGDGFEDLFSYVRTQAGRGAEPIVEAIRGIVNDMPGGAAAFITGTLLPTGAALDTIVHAAHSGAAQSSEINRLLRTLGWLSGKEWVPPLLAFWCRHGQDAAALLAFLRALDRFAFGVRIMGLGSDKRQQRMATLAAQVAAGAPATGPWPPLQLGRDDLRAISFNLRDLHKRSPQVCKLVLLRLEEYFSGAPVTATTLTIEHILPLKIGAEARWRIDFPDAEQRPRLAASLGNLTLVAASVNDRAANHDFARKMATYFAPTAQPVCRLTEDLRGMTTWTPASIEARQATFDRAIAAIWQFGPAAV